MPNPTQIDFLQTLISNVSWFQGWVGVNNPAAALAFIFTGEVAYPIKSVSIAGGVMTIFTVEPNEFATGDSVTISGASVGPQSSLAIAGRATVISAGTDSITVASSLPDLATVFPDQAILEVGVRPFACVTQDSEQLINVRSIGIGANIASGSLGILIEADTSSQYQSDPTNAIAEARDAANSFAINLQAAGDGFSFMALNSAAVVKGPEFIALDEQDDNTNRFERWRALVKVTWGLEG